MPHSAKICLYEGKNVYVQMSILVMLVKLSMQLNHTSHLNAIFTIATGTCGFEKKQEQDIMCSYTGALPRCLLFLLAQTIRNSFSVTLLCLC